MVAPAAIFASVAQAQSDATAASANTSRATYNAGDRFIRRFYCATAVLVGGRRALRPGILLEHFEGPDAAASGNVGEIGIAGAHHIRPGGAAGDGDVLLAVELPGDRLSDDAGGGLEFPQNLAAIGIDRHEFAGETAGEHQAAGGDERAREIGAFERHRPLRLAGEGIHRPQIAATIGIIEEIGPWPLHTVMRLAGLEVGDLARRQWWVLPAEVHGIHVDQLAQRTV